MQWGKQVITTESAPGKVILCGEHAVVYGQPAIALPLPSVRATARIDAATPGTGIVVDAPDVGERWQLTVDQTHPLATLLRLTFAALNRTAPLDAHISLRSAIPIASGMGSGAALGAALVKAVAAHLGTPLPPADVSRLVYESERFFHGTPSGIDNTVVSYEQAIWFVRGDASMTPPRPPTIELIDVGQPFRLVIGDTGVRAPTHLTVGGVRERRQRDPRRYDSLFRAIGALAHTIRSLLAAGDLPALGAALNRNQELLAAIGVSSPELERLISAARAAGALGAKLSGGGGGGIMLALAPASGAATVTQALLDAGSVRILETSVPS